MDFGTALQIFVLSKNVTTDSNNFMDSVHAGNENATWWTIF